MFGNGWFGPGWFAESYFGPVGEKVTGGKLTPEEAEGLDLFGRAREGIKDTPEIPEVSILPEGVEIPEGIDVDLIPERVLVPVSTLLQDKLEGEEDIGLLLAMVEAHEN